MLITCNLVLEFTRVIFDNKLHDLLNGLIQLIWLHPK